jgi:hypothetical protein
MLSVTRQYFCLTMQAGPVMDRRSLELVQALVEVPPVAAQGFDACSGALGIEPAAREYHAASVYSLFKSLCIA